MAAKGTCLSFRAKRGISSRSLLRDRDADEILRFAQDDNRSLKFLRGLRVLRGYASGLTVCPRASVATMDLVDRVQGQREDVEIPVRSRLDVRNDAEIGAEDETLALR